MKFTAESKILSDNINSVLKTTGGADINFEVGAKGVLILKSSSKGFIHHQLTDIIVEEGEKGEVATVPAQQLLGLINRRGTITLEVNENNGLNINNKNFRVEVALPPPKDVDLIKKAESTLILSSDIIQKIHKHMPSLNITNLISDATPTVRMRCHEGNIQVFCADEMHLVYYSIAAEGHEEFTLDLPHSDLSKLFEIIEEDPSTTFSVEDARVYVKNARTTISFPKQQVGKLIPFNVVDAIKNKCIRDKSPSVLENIQLEELIQNVDGCKQIASDQTAIELTSNVKKGKTNGYSITYATPHGRIRTTGEAQANWKDGDSFKANPFIFSDFLESLELFPEVDLKLSEKLLYSHIVQGSDYEAFHTCSGN